MKRTLLLLCLFISAQQLNAQVYEPGSVDEIGIKEKLGDTIPLDLVFTNEHGKYVQLDSLISRPTILSFVYFDCPSICTPILENIADVLPRTGLELGKDFDVLSISFNKKDDPYKAQKKKNNISCSGCEKEPNAWSYLTGDSATIQEIMTSVGMAVKRTGNDFVHAGAIVVVSPQGRITRYLYGIKYMSLDLKMALIEAQNGLDRPTVHRVLKFCYSYDPEGKRYGMNVTKVIGTFILIIMGLVLAFLFYKKRRKK